MIMKPLTDRKWKGYSFEELQDQILVNEIRIDLLQKKIDRKSKPLREAGKSGKNVMSIAMYLLDYVDYIRFGLTAFRKIRGLFRRRKK